MPKKLLCHICVIQKSSSNSSVFSKIAEMGTEQDRGIFLERLFSFMSYRGTPITAVPVICKQTVDLYRLYHLVRERGGMVDVSSRNIILLISCF